MNIVELEDVKIHWREDGNPAGLPVVFANSLGTDLRLWDKIIPMLPQSLRLIRFDKRGHGLSSCTSAPYNMATLVQDTEHLLDHLDVRDCVFVGLSIGGMIAQGLATKRPDLTKALVLSNTGAKMGGADMWQQRISGLHANGINGMSEAVLERWFGAEFLRSIEVEAWRNMLERTPLEGYIGCCHALADADLTAQTAKLKLPALGIAGSEDGASPPALVRDTLALIAGSRFETIQGAGHLPCVEAPEQYAALLTAFLQEVGHV